MILETKKIFIRKLLISVVVVFASLEANSFPYKNGYFSPDDLVKVIKADVQLQRDMLNCKLQLVRNKKPLLECNRNAVNARNLIVSSLSSISKRLPIHSEINPDTVEYFCGLSKNRSGECNLTWLVDNFCKQNRALILTVGGGYDKCDLDDVNIALGSVRNAIISGKLAGS